MKLTEKEEKVLWFVASSYGMSVGRLRVHSRQEPHASARLLALLVLHTYLGLTQERSAKIMRCVRTSVAYAKDRAQIKCDMDSKHFDPVFKQKLLDVMEDINIEEQNGTF